MFEGICEALHRELESLDNKLMGGKAPMSSQDLEVIDKTAHALKSIKAYDAMVNHEYEGGRSRLTGRYYESDYRRY